MKQKDEGAGQGALKEENKRELGNEKDSIEIKHQQPHEMKSTPRKIHAWKILYAWLS